MNSKTQSILLAGAVTLGVALWMLSGIGNDPNGAAEERPESAGLGADGNPERPARVVVHHSVARDITREIVVSGRTEPNREVELKVQTDGAVATLGAERGSRVTAGQRIVTLEMRDRESSLAETEALVEQTRLQYEAAERLRGQQFISEAQIAESRARYISAQAARQRILDDIAYTTVDSPFDGVLQERGVELGDYVTSGDVVAHVVDTNPIIVVGEVNERAIHDLAIGSPGTARLIGGETLVGTIRYLAPVADSNTRTFRVELAIPNPDYQLRAGMSAELKLAADQITAHSLSPALLTLADDGTVGVKAVDAENRVRFHEIELVGSSPEGITVTGIPADLKIISVGQGFVIEGQLVEPVTDTTNPSGSDN